MYHHMDCNALKQMDSPCSCRDMNTTSMKKSTPTPCCEKCAAKDKRGSALYLVCMHPYCSCHSQEPQQEGWIEKKVEEWLLIADEPLKKNGERGDWISAALTEAYNLGEQKTYKEGFEAGQQHAFGVDRKRVKEEGIRSERERILAALKEREQRLNTGQHSDESKLEAYQRILEIEHIARRIISPPNA
jgi:hypothetical protein